jgi:hypothetical protein
MKNEEESMERKTVLAMVLLACVSMGIINVIFRQFAKAFTPTPVVSLNPLPNVYVDPSEVIAWPGMSVNVSVRLNSMSTNPPLNLTGWEVGLQWNANIINITEWFPLGNYSSYGCLWNLTVNSSQQTYLLWDAFFQGNVEVIDSTNSPFTLLTVTFKGISAGISQINLTDVLLIFPSADSLTTYDRPSDVLGEGYVGGDDCIYMARQLYTTPSSTTWNANFDIDDNKVINIVDLQIVADDFGTPYPLGTILPTKTVFQYEVNVQNGSAWVYDGGGGGGRMPYCD